MANMAQTAKNALVFSGRNGLDFIELRSGVLRIPDITLRIREAQKILDMPIVTPEGDIEPTRVDLMNVISSDDEMFFRNIQMKSLASAIVQVGLFDRYMKTQKRPDFMVGNSNGDSAMMVCSGRMSFREMVESSQAYAMLRKQEGAEKTPEKTADKTSDRTNPPVVTLSLVAGAAMPLLSGLNLTEYSALESRFGENGLSSYATVEGSSMELRKIVATLHQEKDVVRFVNLGPASALRGSDYRAIGSGEIESLDSIELDPMLGWFWRNVRPQAAALAQ
jgi:hypothetical protein